MKSVTVSKNKSCTPQQRRALWHPLLIFSIEVNKKEMSCVCKDCRPNHKLHDSYQGQSLRYITASALLQSKIKGRSYELICLTSSLTPILNH